MSQNGANGMAKAGMGYQDILNYFYQDITVETIGEMEGKRDIMIWKIIGNVMSFMGKCKRDKINAYSAQSAFFIILSLIPFLMVFSSLLQYTSVTEGTLLKIIERCYAGIHSSISYFAD